METPHGRLAKSTDDTQMRPSWRRSVLAVTNKLVLVLAIGIVLLSATPASAYHSFTIPARDNGCGVDLKVEAEHGSGGASTRIGYGDITFTNLETGATYLQRSRYTATSTYDESTKSWDVHITGNIWMALYPGEAGPSGVVQEPGLELLVSGTLEFTVTRKDVVTYFSLTGTYDDLCALLTVQAVDGAARTVAMRNVMG